MRTDDRATYTDPSDLPDDTISPAAPPERYLLGERLGIGGMGEVRAATDTHLGREVAIKLLREERSSGRARFLAEAQITARLEHPNIVPVHDLGETGDGRPYLAMKRVRGRTLYELLTTGQLKTTEEKLEIFRKLCDAVAFAHARGVLHRDLKPDNVMVGEFGEVLLMDWGVARNTGDLALPGEVVGTPAYMAPEQARGEPLSAQADVYGLGAVLYELLVGHPPREGPTARVLLEAQEEPPLPPRQRAPQLSAELERVILRAMASHPQDRHPGATALREDIDAVIARRPLVHVRSTPSERLAHWATRHRGPLSVAACALVLGLTGLSLGVWRYSLDVGRARDVAVQAADRARAAEMEAVGNLVAAQVALADALAERGLGIDAQAHLQAADALVAGRSLDRRSLDLAWSRLVAEQPPPVSRCRPHGGSPARALDLRRDGREALSWGDDARLVRWDPLGCAERAAQTLSGVGPGAVDAERGLATALIAGSWLLVDVSTGAVQRWTAPTGAIVVGLDGDSAWARDREGRVWTVRSQDEAPRFVYQPEAGAGYAWPARGGTLWLEDSVRSGAEQGGVRRASDHQRLLGLPGVNAIALPSVGEQALVGYALGVRYGPWDGTKHWSKVLPPVTSVGVAPGDQVGWAQGFDGSVRLLSLDAGDQVASYVGPGALPSAIAASTDARLIALSSPTGEVLVYLRPPWATRRPPQPEPVLTQGIALSGDGALLATADDLGRISIYDTATSRLLARWSGWPGLLRQAAFAPDGLHLAVAARTEGLLILDLVARTVRTVPLDARTVSVAWLDSGVYSVDVGGMLHRYRPETGELAQLGTVQEGASWALAEGGKDLLLTAGHHGKDKDLVLLSATSGAVIRRIPLHETGYQAAASSDGRLAAVGTQSGEIHLLDLQTGAPLRTLLADAGPTMGVAFSPDGTLLASTGYSRQVKLWDVATGALLRAEPQHEGPGLSVRFSPDGGLLYSSGSDGWRVLPLRASAQHEAAVAALQDPAARRAEALVRLGWWERVEEVAGPADRRLVAQARLALNQAPLASNGDPYLHLLELAAQDGSGLP